MIDNDDIFASAGGSLLNDLLSDLDAVVKTATASTSNDDVDDDILASLERELASSYTNPTDGGDGGALLFSAAGPPPGMMTGSTRSAAAFVVGHQSHRATQQLQPPPGTSSLSAPNHGPGSGGGRGGGNHDDSWATALSQFGGMSLAADFLAADSAKKGKQQATGGSSDVMTTDRTVSTPGAPDDGLFGDLASDVMGKLFEGEEDYDAEEKVMLSCSERIGSVEASGSQSNSQSKLKDGKNHAQTDGTGGLLALLGASRAIKQGKQKSKQPQQEQQQREAVDSKAIRSTKPKDVHPSGPAGSKAPPPSPMFSAHHPPSMGSPTASPRGYSMPPPGAGGLTPPHSMLSPPFPGGMLPPPPSGPPGGQHPSLMRPPVGGREMMYPMMMEPQMHPHAYNGGRPSFIAGPCPQPPPPHHLHGRGHPHPRPPHHLSGPLPPHPSREKESVLQNNDYPALGSKEQESLSTEALVSGDDPTVKEKEAEVLPVKEPSETLRSSKSSPAASTARVIFNNPHPRAPPIPGSMAASSLMPSRDVCYVVHSMLRPLQSLDAYNDDYYHWSFVDRQSRNLLMLGGGGGMVGGANEALPNPVWKEVKVMVKEREEKYREVVETRAKDWSEGKHILGHTVKTNVKRPRALLSTPVLNQENAPFSGSKSYDGEKGSPPAFDEKLISDYEAEQQRHRVSTWTARVAIDKGYNSYLTLVELRRLIQANHGSAPKLVQDLMGDVKNNVDLLHASFGIQVQSAPDGNRQIAIQKEQLSSALSLPKGRVLCARVIEGGILPHPSACEILPAALRRILSSSLPVSHEGTVLAPPAGEDRLLRALTSLVLTMQPSVEPRILCECLDVSISVGKSVEDSMGSNSGEKDGQKSMVKITGSRTRMELVHAILSRGKVACVDAMCDVWTVKEKVFMELLSASVRAAGGQGHSRK